ncbi:MAG TPA: F0F1 ATP synthase subunit gamma [Bryobacteraceae bacterium]|nr:F0F1 ATP synthase subunit gamma [Bryobacteraceae bacterium]
MSRRREIEASVRGYREIRDILNAMKNMARMEVHRLGRFLVTQQRVVSGIEAAGSDFVTFYPALFPQDEPSHEIHLLLGSERGFCGDFNERLLSAFGRRGVGGQTEVVVLGSKLRGKLPRDLRVAAFLESASAVEEVEGVLVQLMDTLSGLANSRGTTRPLRVIVFHHRAQGEDVQVSVLQPFGQPGASPRRFINPPRLYLDPVVFANGLVEQYLFARLHELLFTSLMVENQIRVQHMDSAAQRLERKSAELLRRRNTLRQEEITEEIEVIMLSAGMLT